MDEFSARALGGKMGHCAARKNTRTGRGKRGMVAHRRLLGKRSLYFHCIIWHNRSGLKFTHNSPPSAAKKEKKNFPGMCESLPGSHTSPDRVSLNPPLLKQWGFSF